MTIDAIIVSSDNDTTLSYSSQFRLYLDGELATIQRIKALIKNNGKAPSSDASPDRLNFHDAVKLNGLTIFSYLLPHFKCEVIDALEHEEQRFKELLKQSPKFVIISTSYLYNKKSIRELTCKVKALCPGTTIIMGGPFVLVSYMMHLRKNDDQCDTDSPQNDLLFLNHRNEPLTDYYVIGHQGLDTLLHLMRAIVADKPVDTIPNIAYDLAGKLHFNPVHLDAEYKYIQIKWEALPEHVTPKRVASLQASNGCPFKCSFCNFVKGNDAAFVRTIDDIVADLEALQSLGVKYVRFADDNFRLGKPDLEEFCHKVIDSDIHTKWHSFMRLSNLQGVDLRLLKKAGCIEVLLGLESASPQILDNMNKRINPDIYRRLIQDMLAVGINVASTFIIGFPGETLETARETIDFIKSINTEDCQGKFKWSLFPFTLLPLSPIYEAKEREKYNLKGYMYEWAHETMDASTARGIIKKAYLEIQGTGPGYTSDNLDDLSSLSADERKQFDLARYKLSKVANRELSRKDYIETFSSLLG